MGRILTDQGAVYRPKSVSITKYHYAPIVVIRSLREGQGRGNAGVPMSATLIYGLDAVSKQAPERDKHPGTLYS